jgi:PKD repeat protein
MKKIIVLLLLIFVSILIFGAQRTKKIEAGASDNVSGFAWSENIGWISFNNTTGGGATNYGVNIDPSNGIFSGYAWSRGTDADVGGVGWISFADFDGDGDVDANDKNISGSPCAPNCEAKLDLGTNEVSGWARALSATNTAVSGGWDGWIKLRSTNYGVSWDSSAQELKGWAWGGDDSTSTAVVGWISFNHKNCDTDGDGTMEAGEGTTGCPPVGTSIPTYKVLAQVNNLPSAINLPVTVGEYCFANSPPIILSWNFSDPGDTQSAYQVQTATNLSFTPTTTDSGKVTGPSGASTNITPILSYGTTYYWRVKVWDSKGASSNWAATDTSFTTAAHAYPRTNFTFSPSFPTVNEVIQFTDQTVFYDGATGWSWNFGDGGATTTQNPTHSYSKNGTYSVTLNASDDIGNCSISKDAKASSPPPKWREIPPY